MFLRLLARVRPRQRQFFAMGTLVTVTLAQPDRSTQSADDALDEVQRWLTAFGRDAWAWGDGRLAQLNLKLQSGMAITLPDDLRGLFERAWDIHLRSGGRFDPRVAELVRLWGFDDPAHLRNAPPATADIEHCLRALRTAPAYTGGGVYGPAPGTGWDFGAIGKGYAVDAALALLAQRGIAHASVDAGGNLAVRGRVGRRHWRVGIRDPRSSVQQPDLLATLDACNEAVITHGDDQRGFEHAGRRYAHILDPHSGWPAGGLRSLTVVHADATYADAAGSALFVAGPRDWPQAARELGLSQVLALDHAGQLSTTAQLAPRLRCSGAARLHVV